MTSGCTLALLLLVGIFLLRVGGSEESGKIHNSQERHKNGIFVTTHKFEIVQCLTTLDIETNWLGQI